MSGRGALLQEASCIVWLAVEAAAPKEFAEERAVGDTIGVQGENREGIRVPRRQALLQEATGIV